MGYNLSGFILCCSFLCLMICILLILWLFISFVSASLYYIVMVFHRFLVLIFSELPRG